MPNRALPPETGDIALPESVVEAAARALFENDGLYQGMPWEGLARDSRLWAAFRSDARAALLAALPHFQAMQTEAVLAEREKASAFLCAEAADYEAAGPFGMVVCAALTQASSDLQNEKHVAIRERKP